MIVNLRLMEAKVVYKITEAVVALEKQIKKELRKRALEQADTKLLDTVKLREKNRKNKGEEADGGSDISEAGGEDGGIDFFAFEVTKEEAGLQSDDETKQEIEQYAQKTTKK